MQLARPSLPRHLPSDAATHLTALLAMAGSCFWIATALTRRRLLK